MIKDSLAHTRTYTPEERLRMHGILKESEERYRHALLDPEEGCELHDRIVRLKTRLARAHGS